MEIDLIWITSTITALLTICGIAWKLHVFLSRMEKKFEKYDATINDNTIHILKMSLLCDDLPITDRIEAGRKYLELGGNGYGHIVYDKLIDELEKRPPTPTKDRNLNN